jgi:hypothetical protein
MDPSGCSALTLGAVKTLAAHRVVERHGDRLWASPCLSRLDDRG